MSDLPPTTLTKTALRKQAMSLRKQLPMATISQHICQRILRFEGFESARRIFFYHPMNHELDLRPLVHQCPEKTWFLPVVQPEQTIHFVACPSLDQLRPGAYGILEPMPQEDATDCVRPHDMRPDDCLILPGLLFDRRGYRVGYGKGYFDRFVAAMDQAGRHCVLLGAVPADLLRECLPRDPWDQSARWIITERETFATGPKPAGPDSGG